MPDLDGLSDGEKAAKVAAYKKHKSIASSKRNRTKATESHEELQTDGLHPVVYRTMVDLTTGPGGIVGLIKVDDTFPAKHLVIHAIRSLAEVKGVRLRWKKNDSCRIWVVPFDRALAAATLSVDVRFDAGMSVWVVKSATVNTSIGTEPGFKKRGSNFRDSDLVRITTPLILADYDIKLKVLKADVGRYLRFPKKLRSSRMSRIRRMAHVKHFGVPDSNIELLPVLEKVLCQAGHHLSFETIRGPEMKKVVLTAAKDEHERRARNLLKKQREESIPFSRDDLSDLRDWDSEELRASGNGTPRSEWVDRNSALLTIIGQRNRKYVSKVFLSFRHAREKGTVLLGFFNADACHGKKLLSAYTLFIVLGLNSNFSIVPLAYVWQMSNECTRAWTATFNYVNQQFPWFAGKATLASDRDKGISNAIQDVFPAGLPKQFYCVVHRKKNLAPFGKKALKVYDSLVYAKTMTRIRRIRVSEKYLTLTARARAAIDNVDDKVQFLAACASGGGRTYGRTSSQAVESQNATMMEERNTDLLNSVLGVCEKEYTRFSDQKTMSQARKEFLPPRPACNLAKASEGLPKWDVVELPADGGETRRFKIHRSDEYYVICTLRPIMKLPAVEGEDAEISHFDVSCECGVPAIQRSPCSDALLVAAAFGIDSTLFVPPELWTTAWRAQYPPAMIFTVPTREDLENHPEVATLRDADLFVPVMAPPKRGRPRLVRLRSAMEKNLARNVARNERR